MKTTDPAFVLERHPASDLATDRAPMPVNPVYSFDAAGDHPRRAGIPCGLDGTSRGALLVVDLERLNRKQALAMFRQLKAAVLADAGALKPADASEALPANIPPSIR